MKQMLVGFLAAAFLIPSVSMAAPLTSSQVSAIIEVLQAFGVDPATVALVQNELAPPATTTPITLGVTQGATSTPVTPSTFTPIQTVTPSFGGVSVQQVPVAPPPCDDTPTITVSSTDGQSGSFVMASTSQLEFKVTATSACGSSFFIDEISPSQRQQNHFNSPSGTSGQSFYFVQAPAGSYQVYFVAHDRKTTATSTVNVNVQ